MAYEIYMIVSEIQTLRLISMTELITLELMLLYKKSGPKNLRDPGFSGCAIYQAKIEDAS